MRLFILAWLLLSACDRPGEEIPAPPPEAFQAVQTISHQGISVEVFIDKPATDDVDVLVAYPGTVWYDSLIVGAAQNVVRAFKRILDREDMMLVGVAYPQENLLLGDNIREAEAALLWVLNQAEEELGVNMNKVFLGGHSQGGYLVTRLNTMHQTHGVIANAPGPLNLVFRCSLEEDGRIPGGLHCAVLEAEYGSTTENPDAYYERSLLNFTQGFRSDILFVQGMEDSSIQMHSWPLFKQQMEDCTDCQDIQVLELPGYGHQALFHHAQARTEFNRFINER